MVASYHYCPTGNEADQVGRTVLTEQALNHPCGSDGFIKQDDDGQPQTAVAGSLMACYAGAAEWRREKHATGLDEP